MKKIFLLIAFFIASISYTFADVSIHTYPTNRDPSYYVDYGDKQRYFSVSSTNGFEVTDEGGTLISSKYADVSPYGDPPYGVFHKASNGDVVYLSNGGYYSSTYNPNGVIYYYDSETDIIYQDTVLFGSGQYCASTVHFAKVDDSLVLQYTKNNPTNSNCSYQVDANIYKLDLINEPTGDEFLTAYTGGLVLSDLLPFSLEEATFGEGSDKIYTKAGQYLAHRDCSEDFGGYCSDFYRIDTGSGNTVNQVYGGSDGVGKVFYSVKYTDTENLGRYVSFVDAGGGEQQLDHKFVQRMNYSTNEVLFLHAGHIDNLEFVPNNKTSPLVSQIDSAGEINYIYPSGSNLYLFDSTVPFTNVLTSNFSEVPPTHPDFDYSEEEAFNWDADGDGDIELLNGEIFTGIANSIKYFFSKIFNFFGNLKALLEKLGEIGTQEEKTFSFNFIPKANANTEISGIINNSVDEEAYGQTVLGKMDKFFKAFMVFFALVMGLVIFIGINKKS